jgi:hypothetical protein
LIGDACQFACLDYRRDLSSRSSSALTRERQTPIGGNARSERHPETHHRHYSSGEIFRSGEKSIASDTTRAPESFGAPGARVGGPIEPPCETL